MKFPRVNVKGRHAWWLVWAAGALAGFAGLTVANDADTYQVRLQITRQERVFHMVSSFRLPLGQCAAYRYLTDYDAIKKVTGVLDSVTTRMGPGQARVERWGEETVMFVRVKLHSVIDFSEQPYQGTQFVQYAGDARQYRGGWRIEPDGDGSRLHFDALMEPDSALPMFVLQYFIQHKMRDRMGEMALQGALRQGQPVTPCE